MDYSHITGSKAWDKIHEETFEADLHSEKRDSTIISLKTIFNNYPCPSCKSHLMKYLEEHPIEKAEKLFVWGWELHNDVNLRTNKQIIDYETAYSTYKKKCEKVIRLKVKN